MVGDCFLLVGRASASAVSFQQQEEGGLVPAPHGRSGQLRVQGKREEKETERKGVLILSGRCWLSAQSWTRIIRASKILRIGRADSRSPRSRALSKQVLCLFGIFVVVLTSLQGLPLPHIDYTEDEVRTWGVVFNKLKAGF